MSYSADVNAMRDEKVEASGGVGALEREVVEERRYGVNAIKPRLALFKYDVNRAKMAPEIKSRVTTADMWGYEKVADTLHRMHVAYGVDNESEAVLAAFDRALFICVALNGSSVQTDPKLISFYVGKSEFSYEKAHQILGNEPRRFYRPLATNIVEECEWLMTKSDDNDPEILEMRNKMRLAAIKKGIRRKFWLVSDVAEHADLSINDLDIVMSAKAATVGGTTNSADVIKAAPVVRSLDNYDSSVHRNVPMKYDTGAEIIP